MGPSMAGVVVVCSCTVRVRWWPYILHLSMSELLLRLGCMRGVYQYRPTLFSNSAGDFGLSTSHFSVSVCVSDATLSNVLRASVFVVAKQTVLLLYTRSRVA